MLSNAAASGLAFLRAGEPAGFGAARPAGFDHGCARGNAKRVRDVAPMSAAARGIRSSIVGNVGADDARGNGKASGKARGNGNASGKARGNGNAGATAAAASRTRCG